MALFPCDATGHRYPGPQRTMYPAVSSGSLSHRRKLRLCKQHFEAFEEQLAIHALDQDADFTDPASSQCYLCGQPVGGTSSALYVTAYGKSSDRQDWWAPLHDNCMAGAMADWLIEPETA